MRSEELGEPIDALRTALQASGVVGTWEWIVTYDRVVLDEGAAAVIAGDPDLANRELTLAQAKARLHADDRDWVFEHLRQLGRRGGLLVAEYRVVTPTGQERWILDRGRVEPDPATGLLRGHGILIDITESRLADKPYVTIRKENAGPVEQAVEHCLAARDLVADTGRPHLRLLLDMALLDLGRLLGQAETARRRGSLN